MDELVKIEKIVSNGSEKDNRTKNSNNGAKAGVLKIPPDSNAERVVTNNDKCRMSKMIELIKMNLLMFENKQIKDVRELPGSLFGNPPIGAFLAAIHPGIKLEIRHYDYDTLFPEKKIYWIASVNKVDKCLDFATFSILGCWLSIADAI
uniref:Uncharacterized protein n=1 Tax=Meloidogyne hapla TaxID=6305 RepID=A0A1I8BM78_MELHA